MSTNATSTEESTATPDLRLCNQHDYLGIDGEGYIHHLDRETFRVHRIEPDTGARERVSDLAAYCNANDVLPGAATDIYVHDYIGDRVGWSERYSTTNRDVFGGF